MRAQSPPSAPIVVLLHSYNSAVDWTHDIGEGLYTGLRDGGMNVDLREEYLDGAMGRDEYVSELSDLADRCRRAGLLPLPSRQP